MPYGDRLFALLSELDSGELESIWTQCFKRKKADKGFDQLGHAMKVELLSMEFRSVHGHTVCNLFRHEHALPWKTILIDVADKLKPGLRWTGHKLDDATSEAGIEREILTYFDDRARDYWAKLGPEEREKLRCSLEQEGIDPSADGAAQRAQFSHLSVSTLSLGISSGLLTGAGAMIIAQAGGAGIVGGVLGGTLYQASFWLISRVMGWFAGVQLAASGTMATVAGALTSIPVLALLVSNALMATSYRKSIPATLSVLIAHELRRQVAAQENAR